MSGLSLAGTGLTITGGSGTAALEIGTTTIIGGTTGRVLYDNGGVLGETTIASGLYGPVLTGTVPTTANTGLSTWYNQNSCTLTEASTGLVIARAMPLGSAAFSGRMKTAPTAPYIISALVAVNIDATGYAQIGLAFSDGTKQSNICFTTIGANGAGLYLQNWSNATTYVSTNYQSNRMNLSNPVWMQIADDGTNVYFRYSADGSSYITLYSIDKASGYLGATGYSNVGFFASLTSGAAPESSATLMSWVQT